jgi:hypothetical protein
MIEENQGVSTENDENQLQFDEFKLESLISIFIKNNEQAKGIDDSRVLLYRGQADKGFDLVPSIFRKGRLVNEHKMIQQLLLRSPDSFSDVQNPFERLVKMQHYGLPTRLLDVTTNPLVALYFACIDCLDKDGEIIVFYDYVNSHNESNVRLISALSEYSGKSEQGMRVFFDERGFQTSKINTRDLLGIPYILVEPPMNNERIKRQSGAFALVGVRQDDRSFEKTKFDLRELVMIKENEGIERSIVIPKEYKVPLLDELDVIGINKAFLFPELEHQATYIISKYEEG